MYDVTWFSIDIKLRREAFSIDLHKRNISECKNGLTYRKVAYIKV